MADLYSDHFGVLFFLSKRGIGVVCLNSGSYHLNTILIIYVDWTDCLQAVEADRKFGGMARFKHETTNRKAHVAKANKDNFYQDWKPLKAIYPVKCAACKEWIAKDAQILWHVDHKLVMHVDCPIFQK